MANLVEIIVENYLKTICKTYVKLCKTFFYLKTNVYKIIYQPTFPYFSTISSTTLKHLYQINLFHYSTTPTTKTTKYINIVKKGNLYEN